MSEAQNIANKVLGGSSASSFSVEEIFLLNGVAKILGMSSRGHWNDIDIDYYLADRLREIDEENFLEVVSTSINPPFYNVNKEYLYDIKGAFLDNYSPVGVHAFNNSGREFYIGYYEIDGYKFHHGEYDFIPEGMEELSWGDGYRRDYEDYDETEMEWNIAYYLLDLDTEILDYNASVDADEDWGDWEWGDETPQTEKTLKYKNISVEDLQTITVISAGTFDDWLYNVING